MKKSLRIVFPLALFTIIPTILIWVPFFLRLETFWGIPLPDLGMATIVSNYDGPLHITVAKSLYNPQIISTSFDFPLPTQYFAAHFPLYPLLIKLFSLVLGYPYAMLFVTIASSFLALLYFYLLANKHFSKSEAMFLTFVFSIFPARWLIVRSVGSAEPLFVATIVASIYYFNQKKYLLAGIFGALAQMTKSPGILLFISYTLAIAWPTIKKLGTQKTTTWIKNLKILKYWPIFLIPAGLLAVFTLYGIQMNDFWAYFHSGDNIHLFFPPFQVFNYSAPWVGTFWLEEIIFVYLLSAIGLLNLIKTKQHTMAWFVGVFLTSLIFVSHRDVLRYAIPILPFLIFGFSQTLLRKEFKFILIILIIPIYLFSIVYISQNTMPITDWAPLL